MDRVKTFAVAAVAFAMTCRVVLPWAWRQCWEAASRIEWQQAEFDDDVVDDAVWEAIVAAIESQGEETLDDD